MPEGMSPKIVTPDDGRTVRLFGVRFDYKIESGDSAGKFAAMEVTVPAKTLVKPHNHANEDEYSLILSGTVGLRVMSRDVASLQRSLPAVARRLGVRLTRVEPLDDSLESVFEYLATGTGS